MRRSDFCLVLVREVRTAVSKVSSEFTESSTLRGKMTRNQLKKHFHVLTIEDIWTMLHKNCRLLFFACKIGDLKKAGFVRLQKSLFIFSPITYFFNYASKAE